jgi:hypothetical protein
MSRFGIRHIVAIHWNGTVWAIQGTPSLPRDATPSLHGGSCRTAAARMAIGVPFNGNGTSRTLAERYS